MRVESEGSRKGKLCCDGLSVAVRVLVSTLPIVWSLLIAPRLGMVGLRGRPS